MKKEIALLSALTTALVLLVAFIPGSAFAQRKPVILRLVVSTPAGDKLQTYRDTEMAKRFNERAKGEYSIEVYPGGGGITKIPEFFDAVRTGVVEMMHMIWGSYSFQDQRLGLLELPFLFANSRATSEATKRMLTLYDPILQERFNAKGLSLMATGGLGLFSQKPIEELGDLKGLLTATVSPGSSVLMKTLGAAPLTIVYTDIYESLSKKIANATTMSSHGGIVLSFTDSCRHFTPFYGISSVGGYAINLDVWKKMPPRIQKILLEETQTAADWMNHMVAFEIPRQDTKTLSEKGVQVHYLSRAEREKWAKLLEPYKEKQFSTFGDLGKRMKEIADDANRKFPYSPDENAL